MDILGAEMPTLHRDIDRGHAAADNDHVAADGQGAFVVRLSQFGDVVNCIDDPILVLTIDAELVRA